MSGNEDRQIRALYDDSTIRVYQAYSDDIADSALSHGTFRSPPFSMDRMTWIKPSFLWMMYRAGWGFKESRQRRILSIDVSREGFDWALKHGCVTHPDGSMNAGDRTKLKVNSPVRIQWDPERDLHSRRLPYRSIQIGLSKEASHLFVNQWIKKVSDITEYAHSIYALLGENHLARAQAMLPSERVYPHSG